MNSSNVRWFEGAAERGFDELALEDSGAPIRGVVVPGRLLGLARGESSLLTLCFPLAELGFGAGAMAAGLARPLLFVPLPSCLRGAGAIFGNLARDPAAAGVGVLGWPGAMSLTRWTGTLAGVSVALEVDVESRSLVTTAGPGSERRGPRGSARWVGGGVGSSGVFDAGGRELSREVAAGLARLPEGGGEALVFSRRFDRRLSRGLPRLTPSLLDVERASEADLAGAGS